ncbi:MAG: PDZ domain-containing protein [Bacillaceae bacterium]|nr:PDZ domain-containing protein [Bacillaceae bacterium]
MQTNKWNLKWINGWLSLLLAVSILLIPVSVSAEENLTEDEKRMLEIYRLLNEYHVDSPDADELADAGIEGMIESLNDPYTVYMSAEEYQAFLNQINGSYSGVGMAVEMKDDQIVVVNPFQGSPAAEAGIEPGDIIIKVDGQSVIGMPLEEVVTLIKGPQGTNVSLTVLRGETQKTFELTRETIEIPLTEASRLDSGTGYIGIYSFGQNVDEEVDKHKQQLEEQGVNGLIIDLRNNPGGLLGPTLTMAENFVAAGKDLLHVKDSKGQMQSFISEGTQYEKPMVILINQNSASASEVFTGALRDNGVAKVVGMPSFGKGVVQTTVPLETGGVLKLTIEEFFTPNHTKIHGVGIMPDIVVENPQQQLAVAEALVAGNPTLTLSGNSNIQIGDTQVTSPLPPALNKNGEWYVSTRAVAALYDGEVGWDPTTRSITLTFAGQTRSYSVTDTTDIFIQNKLSYIKLSVLKQDFVQLSDRIIVK